MGTQVGLIEGRRDIAGGANSSEIGGNAAANRSKHFTTVAYTADGSCILAAGLSKYACIYSVISGALVKKFQLSHNRYFSAHCHVMRRRFHP
jgi:periodic tryptophan protein 2